jgi:peptidoglycan-associated lipoprotein
MARICSSSPAKAETVSLTGVIDKRPNSVEITELELALILGGHEVNSHKKWVLGVVLSALLVLAVGCKKKQPPPPPPPPPVTATLSANPATIQSGQSSTLTWSTQNATDVTLDGANVDPNGSQSVSPTQTTTYHLTAKGAGGTQDAPATVTVIPAPTPTPTPAPTPPPPPPPDDEKIFAQNVQDVYFDFDKSDLRPESLQTLAHSAEVIKQHPNWVVQIQGNCDERGSIEYNLALGERRAGSALKALTDGGVSASQLKTISYGKEKPVCTESNEDCWQKNRRDHFVLLSH